MTWLGKILTFVVLIASVVWMYFTVQAYVFRTNWKSAQEKWQKTTNDSEAFRKAELSRYQASEAALRSQLDNEQKKLADIQKRLEAAEASNKKFVDDFKTQQKVIDDGDVKVTLLQANVDSSLKELDTIRARNTELENQTTGLIVKAEEAKREMIRAQNAAKLSDSIARDYGKKIDELNDKLSELRATGNRPGLNLNPPPPPVLSNLRGEVEQVKGDLVVLSIGIDSGLSKGTVLKLYRLEDGGKYLGTVRILDMKPKESTAVFLPVGAKQLNQLRPDELPRKGDQVEPLESNVIQR